VGDEGEGLSPEGPRRPKLLARAPASVRIVEVGPRDGLQNEARALPASARIAFIEALADAGLSHVEAASFVSPKRVPQMEGAEDVFRGLAEREGVTFTALVPNETGLERALGAGARSVAVFTAASETFNRKNLGQSIAESLDTIRKVADRARREGIALRGYVSMAFVCPFEGRIEPGAVLQVISGLRDAGIASISLGDTLGSAYPDAVSLLLEEIEGRFGIEGFALHLHDTYRRALANALVGLVHGIEEYDASAGGLGGCPFAPGARGNVATEDLADFFEGMGIATGVDAGKARGAAEAVREALGRS
jgi:isopropylmalate/homocitrate/citramalate synthase